MPRRNHFLRLALVLSLLAIGALLAAGCSDETAVPLDTAATDNYEAMDFSQPNAGLTVSDEEEAFGDAALKMELLTEDAEVVADPMADDPEVLAMEEEGEGPADGRPNRPVFTYVALRWGMLHGPDDSLSTVDSGCGVADWTGSIRVDRGALVARRLIKFERPADHLILPRLDRQTVGLVSHTGCHFDGVVLQILERPVVEGQDVAPNMIHIDLGSYEADFEVAALGELDEVYDVDDLGNQFQVTGFSMTDTEVCPKGFLSGRYRMIPATNDTTVAGDENDARHLGNFAGRWMSQTGRIGGFLRGGYGIDADGNRLFVGKYIDRRGHFRGFLRGTWEPADEESDLASFSGVWVNAAETVEGRLGGNAYPVEGVRGGFFAGRWATLCDDEAVAKIK